MVTCAPPSVQRTPLQPNRYAIGRRWPCSVQRRRDVRYGSLKAVVTKHRGRSPGHQLCRHGLSLRGGVLQHRAPHLRSPHRQSWCGAEQILMLASKTSHTRPPPSVSPRLLPSATADQPRTWQLPAAVVPGGWPQCRLRSSSLFMEDEPAAAASVGTTRPLSVSGAPSDEHRQLVMLLCCAAPYAFRLDLDPAAVPICSDGTRSAGAAIAL